MLRYLLDTNVLAEPLKPKPNSAVMKRLKKHSGKLAIATPVWHELWYGCLRLASGKRKRQLETYLVDVLQASLPILAYTPAAARWHASQRARLASKGRTPAFVDGQIASIAAENNLTLVTHNIADFRLFAELRVTDWT